MNKKRLAQFTMSVNVHDSLGEFFSAREVLFVAECGPKANLKAATTAMLAGFTEAAREAFKEGAVAEGIQVHYGDVSQIFESSRDAGAEGAV